MVKESVSSLVPLHEVFRSTVLTIVKAMCGGFIYGWAIRFLRK